MTKEEFDILSLANKGVKLISDGKHLTQFKNGNVLLNLYSLDDFFVEVSYSVISDKIVNIEIINDLSRIDHYIDENQKINQQNKNQI